jgi:hypothetical protein
LAVDRRANGSHDERYRKVIESSIAGVATTPDEIANPHRASDESR